MSLPALNLADEPDDRDWTRFELLPEAERGALLDGLKAEIDRRVRTDPESARPLAEALVRGADSLPARRALAHRARAVVAYFTGRTAQAARDFGEASQLYLAEGKELDAARVQRSLVEVLLSLGRGEEALCAAEAARRTFEEKGEARLLAQLEVNVGNVHFRRDEYAQARTHYETARGRFDALADPLGRAFAEFSLGNLESAAYRLERAADWFHSARSAFGEADQEAQVLDCDASLAWIEAARGRFDLAIEGLEKLRASYVESKPAGVAYCDLDLATLFQRLDAHRDALRHARAARERFEEMELGFERARAQAVEGLCLLALGRAEAAHGPLERARLDFEQLGNANQRHGLDIQRAFLETADAERGEETLARLGSARDAARRSGQSLLEGLATLALARTRLGSGDAEGALRELAGVVNAQERDAAGAQLDALLVADAWRLVARAEGGRCDGAAQRSALERAVEETEASFLHIPTEGVRIAFLRSRHASFRELAWCILEGDEPDAAGDALGLLERSRSRSLARPGSIAGHRPPPEYARARERLDRLLSARLDAELGLGITSGEGGTPAPSLETLQEAEQEVSGLAREFERDLGPAHFDFEAEGGPASLRAGEAALCWIVGPEGARVLIVEAGSVRSVALDFDADEIALQRDRLALQLTKARHGPDYLARHGKRIRRATERALETLGAVLLAPALEQLGASVTALVLVPYGELRGLPFHAMHVGGEPLVARFEVSTTPSLALLARSRRIGGGGFDGEGSVLLSGGDEQSLPALERELARIKEVLGPAARRLPGAEAFALLSKPRKESGVRALHVAAHGVFRGESAAFSGLRLGERFLTAHDVRRMDLDLDLVVLSGCESGRMLQLEGEEAIGLPTAFLAAGVHTVLASLWPVEDEATASFMEELYRALAKGDGLRTALTQVQRAAWLAGEPVWDWAAFELSGRPDA